MALIPLAARARSRFERTLRVLPLCVLPLAACSVELAGLGDAPYGESASGAVVPDSGPGQRADAEVSDAGLPNEGPLRDAQSGDAAGSAGDGGLGDVRTTDAQVAVLSSPSFSDGMPLPDAATCNGENQSPAFSWTAGPMKTRSHALALSSVDSAGTRSVQWALWDIAADARSVPAGVQLGASPGNVPGARQANVVTIPSDVFLPYYRGPCASFSAQEFVFTLYALDVDVVPLAGQVSPQAVVSWIENSGRVLASSELRTPVP